jgi:hypothetical protein
MRKGSLSNALQAAIRIMLCTWGFAKTFYKQKITTIFIALYEPYDFVGSI